MKYEEIIKLLDAGYTREEILAMRNDAPACDPPAGDPPAGDPPAGDPPAGDPSAGDPPADITGEIMKEVKDMFAEMRKELTAMNIMNSRQDGDTIKTGEDILANIINPTRNNGGND